jgi:flagellar protein FliO/FliZ
VYQSTTTSVDATTLLPSIWRATAGTLVVLALLVALAWLVRRGVAGRRLGGPMSVETALSLGDRRSLVIVTVENRRLLIGLAPSQVSLLTELNPPSFDRSLERAQGAGAKA